MGFFRLAAVAALFAAIACFCPRGAEAKTAGGSLGRVDMRRVYGEYHGMERFQAEMQELHVTVVPRQVDSEVLDRGRDAHDVKVDVAVQKKVGSIANEEIDPLLALVQEAVNELIRGRTTFIVAHRLSTIRNASQVLVLRDGRLVEAGRYDDLAKTNGEFAKLKSLQA